MSIRLRLTILYSAIVALTLIAFSIMLYVVVSRVAMNTEQQVLKDEATRITSTVDVANFPRISYPAARLAARETLVQFRQRDGSVTGKTDNLAQLTMELPLSQSAMADVFAHGSRMDFVSMQDGQRLLVYSKSAKVQGLGPPFGVIQVARPMTSYYETLQTLRDILAVSTVVVTLLAFVIGYVLAGAALRPINRLRQTAQAIGSERDFSRRVKYDGPPDEVGRLAMTFNDMLAALQSAYQTQRRFVADASHELRTPLTTIRGNLGLMQLEPPIGEEDRRAVMNDMVDESDRMIRLVNDLLMLARADAGRVPASEPVEVGPLVEDVYRQALLLAPSLVVERGASPSVSVTADRDALKQALLTLVDNAVKFTPPGGTVRLGVEAESGQASISVSDTGPGILADALPHIFERFYQADTARTGQGTGLGLAIAHTLVEAMGGAIAVESEPGRGSTFTITLPIALGAVQERAANMQVGTATSG